MNKNLNCGHIVNPKICAQTDMKNFKKYLKEIKKYTERMLTVLLAVRGDDRISQY